MGESDNASEAELESMSQSHRDAKWLIQELSNKQSELLKTRTSCSVNAPGSLGGVCGDWGQVVRGLQLL